MGGNIGREEKERVRVSEIWYCSFRRIMKMRTLWKNPGKRKDLDKSTLGPGCHSSAAK